MKFLISERQAPYDPETGKAVASRFGAGRFVLGSIIEAGGQLRVSASLYDADGRIGRALLRHSSARGDADINAGSFDQAFYFFHLI